MKSWGYCKGPAGGLPDGTPGPAALRASLTCGPSLRGRPYRASCPGCPQMGIPAHLSPNDPHDWRFQVVPSGKPPAGCLQNEPQFKLQRGVGLLPPGPSAVGNSCPSDQGQGEIAERSRGQPGLRLERVPMVAARRATALSYSDTLPG